MTSDITRQPYVLPVSAGVVGLVVPGDDAAGYPVQESKLNKRLESAKLLMVSVGGSGSSVYTFYGHSDSLGAVGVYGVRCWFVCLPADLKLGQWLELQSGARRLCRSWGLGSLLVAGPAGLVSVKG